MLKKILLSATIVPLVAHSQTKSHYQPPIFTDHARLARIQTVLPTIDKMYQAYAEQNHFPGYVFGIVVDGQLIYSGGGGYTNLKQKIKPQANSMFRIASMTKSFTAMAILKLRDEGKLRLDDPVYLYIPEIKHQKLTQDAPEITIRDLLTHSSGLPQDDPWGDRNLNRTDDELIAIIKKGLVFSNTTGVNYEYSNLAYAMLGLIIKKTSGMSYQTYIEENIWKPLRMQQAAWEYGHVPAKQLAQGYRWINDNYEEEDLLHDGSFASMGGMITSIESFSHYVALQLSAWPPRDDIDTGPVKRSSIREMQQAWRPYNINMKYKSLDGKSCALTTSYGYGLRRLEDCDSNIYVGHAGGLPGFGSHWLIMPQYGIGVIFFANKTYAVSGDSMNVSVLNTLIQQAQLKPRTLPVSNVLMDRQKALLQILPDWHHAEASGIFSPNFFLDTSILALKKEMQSLFKKTGKIIHTSEIVPENQLRGYFIMQGEKANLKISFTLTPESPSLIQSFKAEEISKENAEV